MQDIAFGSDKKRSSSNGYTMESKLSTNEEKVSEAYSTKIFDYETTRLEDVSAVEFALTKRFIKKYVKPYILLVSIHVMLVEHILFSPPM